MTMHEGRKGFDGGRRLKVSFVFLLPGRSHGFVIFMSGCLY